MSGQNAVFIAIAAAPVNGCILHSSRSISPPSILHSTHWPLSKHTTRYPAPAQWWDLILP